MLNNTQLDSRYHKINPDRVIRRTLTQLTFLLNFPKAHGNGFWYLHHQNDRSVTEMIPTNVVQIDSSPRVWTEQICYFLPIFFSALYMCIFLTAPFRNTCVCVCVCAPCSVSVFVGMSTKPVLRPAPQCESSTPLTLTSVYTSSMSALHFVSSPWCCWRVLCEFCPTFPSVLTCYHATADSIPPPFPFFRRFICPLALLLIIFSILYLFH